MYKVIASTVRITGSGGRCDETPHRIHRTYRSPNNAVTGHDSV